MLLKPVSTVLLLKLLGILRKGRMSRYTNTMSPEYGTRPSVGVRIHQTILILEMLHLIGWCLFFCMCQVYSFDPFYPFPNVPTVQCSDSSIFRHPNVPTVQCSDCPMFQHPNVPTSQCSDSSTFRQFNVPTSLCSDNSMFRQFDFPTAQCSDIPMFRHPNFPTPQWSDTSIFRQPQCISVLPDDKTRYTTLSNYPDRVPTSPGKLLFMLSV